MFETAFVLLGAEVTWLEAIAFVLALACVALTVFEIHWGWPLAIVSSLLYGLLFHGYRLYGEAGLQLFFAAIAAWGWWQWLFGRRRGQDAQAGGGRLRIAALGTDGRLGVFVAWTLGWGALGLVLTLGTDSDVPWFDAFPTAGSVIGQILLGRKFVENWAVWILVNAVSVALFAHKELWLTAALYLIFLALAVAGLLRWRRALREQRKPVADAVGSP